jgi:hypothetical protein
MQNQTPAALKTDDQAFINHVKMAILDNGTVPFEVSKLPRGASQNLCKEFLDLIYKTIKSNKSTDDNKFAAIKILKSTVLQTKLTTLIKLLLSCQMWTFFCNQYRNYFNNGKKSTDAKYTDTYFILLEHMLESFKQELGIDNNNRETPFLKLWNAVHKRNSEGNQYFTYFVAIVSNTQHDQQESILRMKQEMDKFETADECNFRTKTLLQNFKKKVANLNFMNLANPNFEEILEFKREFHRIIEKEYYFGDCEAKHYDLFIEILELEEEKLKYMKSPRERPGDANQMVEMNLNLSRFKLEPPPKLVEKVIENEQFSIQATPKQLKIEKVNQSEFQNGSNRSIYSKINPPSGLDLLTNFRANSQLQVEQKSRADLSQLQISPQGSIRDNKPVQGLIDEQFSRQDIPMPEDMRANFQKKPHQYEIFNDSASAKRPMNSLRVLDNGMKAVNDQNKSLASIILNNQESSNLPASLLDDRGRVRNLVTINARRVDALMRMPFPSLKRLKSFAYIRRGRLHHSEICKVGVQVIPKETSEGNRYATVCCFHEATNTNSRVPLPKVEINILSSTKFDLGARKTLHKSEIDMDDFCKYGQYPYAQIEFHGKNKVDTELVEIYIPINKFMTVVRTTLTEFNDLFNYSEYMLTSKFYRMDYNFFRRGFEFMFVFKNLWPLDVEQRSLGGTIELVGVQEQFGIRILINDIREFKLEVYYNVQRNEEKLRWFIEEMVVLFADRDCL